MTRSSRGSASPPRATETQEVPLPPELASGHWLLRGDAGDGTTSAPAVIPHLPRSVAREVDPVRLRQPARQPNVAVPALATPHDHRVRGCIIRLHVRTFHPPLRRRHAARPTRLLCRSPERDPRGRPFAAAGRHARAAVARTASRDAAIRPPGALEARPDNLEARHPALQRRQTALLARCDPSRPATVLTAHSRQASPGCRREAAGALVPTDAAFDPPGTTRAGCWARGAWRMPLSPSRCHSAPPSSTTLSSSQRGPMW